ncbi:hypothetical protein EIP91_008133 [Steccherinum ochraceum]|uniref:BTB domain-containing protein n=1 Tax=Steccherinum ochraceum TaxID=92696 RepID=A0A4R0R904_9APHY|nr:hypothetical protein EIP91_008133 [Steccherinum ochraceum]
MDMQVDPQLNPAFKKSKKLWFEDGSVIIVTGEVGFRVYKGALSACSDVFRDTFAMPQGSGSSQELFEDCPVVRLQDSARDMARFLDVVFNGAGIWCQDESQIYDWNIVRSVLTLSHKYQAERLLTEGIRRLTARFPDTIEKWDVLYSTQGYLGDNGDLISMPNMAKFLSLPHVHLLALYDCCNLSTADLLGGLTNTDGVLEVLSQEDMVMCVDGRINLAEENTKLWEYRFSAPCPENCQKPGHNRCENARRSLNERGLKMARETYHNPLAPETDTYKALQHKMCLHCAEYFVKRDTARRQEIMDNLKTHLSTRHNSSEVDE